MTMTTRLDSNSNGMISPTSNTQPKTTVSDQKVTEAASKRLPCYSLLTTCLKDHLQSKIPESVIKNVSNYLQNMEIPNDKEHYTIQDQLLILNRKETVAYESLNALHRALRQCKDLKENPNQSSK